MRRAFLVFELLTYSLLASFTVIELLTLEGNKLEDTIDKSNDVLRDIPVVEEEEPEEVIIAESGTDDDA